jgi:hypothetical protein
MKRIKVFILLSVLICVGFLAISQINRYFQPSDNFSKKDLEDVFKAFNAHTCVKAEILLFDTEKKELIEKQELLTSKSSDFAFQKIGQFVSVSKPQSFELWEQDENDYKLLSNKEISPDESKDIFQNTVPVLDTANYSVINSSLNKGIRSVELEVLTFGDVEKLTIEFEEGTKRMISISFVYGELINTNNELSKNPAYLVKVQYKSFDCFLEEIKELSQKLNR